MEFGGIKRDMQSCGASIYTALIPSLNLSASPTTMTHAYRFLCRGFGVEARRLQACSGRLGYNLLSRSIFSIRPTGDIPLNCLAHAWLVRFAKSKNHVRANRNLPCRIRLIDAFKISAEKYASFGFSEIVTIDERSAPTRGALRVVTKRGAECGGRDGADRRAAHARTAKSCGPGAPRQAPSSRRCVSHRVGDGGNQAGSPRRARSKP